MITCKECLGMICKIKEVSRELRASQRRERAMWKALCPACKHYVSNGAGIACIANDWKMTTHRNCPLLKGKVKG